MIKLVSEQTRLLLTNNPGQRLELQQDFDRERVNEVVGDFLDKPVSKGGLELSRYPASAALLALILLFIFAFPHRPARREH